MTDPTARFTEGIDRQRRRAMTTSTNLRLRLVIAELTRQLEAAGLPAKPKKRATMTVRELHAALLKVGESLADCRVAIDLGGCVAEVVGVKWSEDVNDLYVELEHGPVRLRRQK